jgi:hypothetical protein
MAWNSLILLRRIGQATLGLGALLGQGLVLALHDWYRKADKTCVLSFSTLPFFMVGSGWGLWRRVLRPRNAIR